MICIYCLTDKTSNCFSKTEHVLPQSFGRFKKNLTLNIKNHPTLGEVVCDECNQWFGNNIENSLARDSREGMARFEHGIKEDRDYASPGKKSRISIKLDEGAYKGAHAYREYSSIENRVVLKYAPQVGFKSISDNASHTYFPINDIPASEYIRSNFDLSSVNSIIILGSELDKKIAVCALSERKIPFRTNGVGNEEKEADCRCEVVFKIDSTIRRAIAKIAFNYLAYVSGPEFVRNDNFNPVRTFIRYGEVGTYPIVRVVERSILGDERLVGKRRLGHIVTLDNDEGMATLYSQVSLFNDITYSILLSNNFRERDFTCRSGHFFNIGNRQISELDCEPSASEPF